MKTFLVLIAVLVSKSTASMYEESLSDMLIQCNSYQEQTMLKNRTIHECEKEDPDGDFSYYITPMQTRYSQRQFLCVLFYKDEYRELDFKLLFSHGKFKVDAYGIKYNPPNGGLFESSVSFPLSILVIVPDKDTSKLDILEWNINGEDQCPSCGEKSQAKGLISGGNETEAASWPWHVSLWKRTTSGIHYICGGSILNKKWTVSAAHCMYADGQIVSEKTLNLRIGTGKLISTSFKQYNVKTLIVHQDYDPITFEHDIALMKLKETLDLSENFRAICFSQLGSLPQASTGVAVGYGSTDRTKETIHSEVLRQVDMPIVDKEDCYDSDDEFFGKHLFPGNFCAGQLNVMKGVCSGDSGGGFYVRINNNWYLQGITSNTKLSTNPLNPTCNYASYAVFTNVTHYTDWINDKIISN